MNDEAEKKLPSDRFRAMAEDIDHNAKRPFGGAVVIHPPEGGGDPIEFLMVGAGDIAQFYGTVQTKIQLVLEGLKQPPPPFGRSR